MAGKTWQEGRKIGHALQGDMHEPQTKGPMTSNVGSGEIRKLLPRESDDCWIHGKRG